MLVFLHGGDPGDVVEGDDAQAEIGVVGDGGDGGEEGGEGWGGDGIHGCEEVGRREAVLVGRGATGLCGEVSGLLMLKNRDRK